MDYCIINCTVSNKVDAVNISKELVKQKLIACSNIIPNVTSVYEWENALHEDSEVLMIMKTRKSLFDKVKEEIIKLHPYKVPEIIAVPLINGNESYISWLDTQIKV